MLRFGAVTTGTGTEGDQSVVYLDDDAVAQLANHLQKDTMDTFEACQVSQC